MDRPKAFVLLTLIFISDLPIIFLIPATNVLSRVEPQTEKSRCNIACLKNRRAIDHFLYYHDYVSYSQPLKTVVISRNPVVHQPCNYHTSSVGFYTRGLYARGKVSSFDQCLRSCVARFKCRSFNFVPKTNDCYFSAQALGDEQSGIDYLWEPHFKVLHYSLLCDKLTPKAAVRNSQQAWNNWSGRYGVPVHAPWYKSEKLNQAMATHAVPHSYPWIVSLALTSRHEATRCSGVLIPTSRYTDKTDLILTAAHCVCEERSSKIANDLTLHVGKIHLSIRQIGEQQLTADTISVHPDYNGTPWNGYDIALIHLTEPVSFNRYFSAIKLPKSDQIMPGDKNKCILAGWQLTRSQDTDDTSKSEIMQQIPVAVLTDHSCKRHRNMFSFHHRKKYHFICAQNKNRVKASCDGDSGGPLACKEDGAFVLYGIVSYGTNAHACRRSKNPTIAMRVGNFLNWIAKENQYFSRKN